jgi:hypothetical protein
MRAQREIVRKVEIYKQQLAMAIEEKEAYEASLSPNIDLMIFSLIDKLETLFWVLEIELPESDVLDIISGVNH